MALTNSVYASPVIMPVHNAEAKFISKNRMQIIIATHVTLIQSKMISELLGICSAIKGPAAHSMSLGTPDEISRLSSFAYYNVVMMHHQ